jgi:hypothetical protein
MIGIKKYLSTCNRGITFAEMCVDLLPANAPAHLRAELDTELTELLASHEVLSAHQDGAYVFWASSNAPNDDGA